MRYILLYYVDEATDRQPDEHPDVAEDLRRWLAETASSRLHGDRLQPVRNATTVRTRQGEVLIADGPFAETKEQVGGYDVIECTDLDEAMEIASRHPAAKVGTVEIRPFWPIP